MLNSIWNKIRDIRLGYTGITGTDEIRNQAKMLGIVLGTFLPLWFGALYAIQLGYIPEEFAGVVILLVLIGWGAFCGGYNMYMRVDATKYKTWPKTNTFMPDGHVEKYTFKIPPKGMTAIPGAEFKDGGIGVHVSFLNRYRYDDERMPFPWIFNEALLKLPADIGKTCKFIDNGEYWHGGMIVDTSTCENVSLYIREFVEYKGRHVPIGVMGDCTERHKRFMNNGDALLSEPELAEIDKWQMLAVQYKRERDQLFQHSEHLEGTVEVLETEQGKGRKEEVDRSMSAIRDRVHLITDVKEPWRSRLMKLPWMWIIVGAIAFLLIARFIFGWI